MLDINYFAVTDFRGRRRRFGIRRADRRLHMYVLGRTGMGKTSLLLNMAINDIEGGEGLCFLDPHGDAAGQLLGYIPSSRADDVVYFDPGDRRHAVPLNVLEQVAPERRPLLVSGVLSIFSKLFGEHWQHRQEHILRNALFALLEVEERPTLLDVYRLLADWRYRKRVAAGVRDPVVAAFWRHEFGRYVFSAQSGAITPILNKLGAFLTSPMIRNVVGQRETGLNFREAMDSGKVLIANLGKGKIGEDGSAFLGALLVLKLQLAAMERVDVPEERRRDFYLYVDEFQNFLAAEGLDGMLSEARKYRLCLTMAHQYLGQLDVQLRQAIFGNVGTIVSFSVGPEDSGVLEKQFAPEFRREDLVDQHKHHIYIRLAIDGVSSKPFSAETLPPFEACRLRTVAEEWR